MTEAIVWGHLVSSVRDRTPADLTDGEVVWIEPAGGWKRCIKREGDAIRVGKAAK